MEDLLKAFGAGDVGRNSDVKLHGVYRIDAEKDGNIRFGNTEKVAHVFGFFWFVDTHFNDVDLVILPISK